MNTIHLILSYFPDTISGNLELFAALGLGFLTWLIATKWHMTDQNYQTAWLFGLTAFVTAVSVPLHGKEHTTALVGAFFLLCIALFGEDATSKWCNKNAPL